MKNFLPAAALFVTFATLAPGAFAQGLHLRGGVNFANAMTDPEPSSPSNREFRQGFNGALLGEFGHGGARLMVGVGYEEKGMHITGAGGGDIRLDYVTVPIMVSMGAPPVNAGAALFFNVGVEPAFLLTSEYSADSFTFDFDNAEDFDMNLRAELGIELPVSYSGPSGILGAAYTYGLTDANKNGNEWNNYAFHLFLGLKIRAM